jgi:hypothetical protein
MVKLPAIRKGLLEGPGALDRETTMADRGGLKLVGLIFASVTIAVMLTTTVVVKGLC